MKYLFFFSIAFFLCSCNSSSHFPDEIQGNWKSDIPIEGTDDTLHISLKISGDTIRIKQEYPRMSGVDKISTTYLADKVETSNSNITAYSTANTNFYRFTFELEKETKLHFQQCTSYETDYKDAEFSSCNERIEMRRN